MLNAQRSDQEQHRAQRHSAEAHSFRETFLSGRPCLAFLTALTAFANRSGLVDVTLGIGSALQDV
jgi:hypothetical protein